MKIHPVRRRIVAVGELYSSHFPYDDGTRVDEALDCGRCCVAWWVEIVESAVSAACAETGKVEDVFYAEAELGCMSVSGDCWLQVGRGE
jgi:hypothetical protein